MALYNRPSAVEPVNKQLLPNSLGEDLPPKYFKDKNGSS